MWAIKKKMASFLKIWSNSGYPKKHMILAF